MVRHAPSVRNSHLAHPRLLVPFIRRSDRFQMLLGVFFRLFIVLHRLRTRKSKITFLLLLLPLRKTKTTGASSHS